MIKRISLFFPFFLVLYELTVNLSNDMYLPAVSLMIHFFQTDAYHIQLTLSAWFAGAMLMNPILGILSDYYGQKNILFYSGLLFLFSTSYCIFPHQYNLFIVARFLQGFTATSIVICGYSLIHQLYDDKQAILITAWISGALILAPMLGPLMGGYIIHLTNWNSVFLILFITAAFSLAGLKIFMPTLAKKGVYQFDLKQELIDYKVILTNSHFFIHTFMYAMLFGGLILWITASPFIFITSHHLSPLLFGLLQLPIFACYIIGILLLKLSLKMGFTEQKIVRLGMTVFFLLLFPIAYGITNDQISSIFIIMAYSIFSLTFGFIASVLNRIAVKSVDVGMGKLMAMFDCIAGVVATMATLFIGASNLDLDIWIMILLLIFISFALLCYFSNLIYIRNLIISKRLP